MAAPDFRWPSVGELAASGRGSLFPEGCRAQIFSYLFCVIQTNTASNVLKSLSC